MMCGPVTVTVTVGQSVYVSSFEQVESSAASTSFFLGLCYIVHGSTATPTYFDNYSGGAFLQSMPTSGLLQNCSISGVETFTAAGNYDIGACFQASAGSLTDFVGWSTGFLIN
jgi:hypothetical protein